jgi:hypothetical protein
MSTSDPVVIQFGPLHLERLSSPPPYDRLLGINSKFRIVVQEREWLTEPNFPVVELAAAVAAWIRRGGDFVFETIEANESPFLAVHREGSNCRIEAAWQAFPIDVALPFDKVQAAFAQFARSVAASTKEQLDIDVDDLLNRDRGAVLS